MTVINKNQGAVKSSEVAMDSALDILGTQILEDNETVITQLKLALADALRKTTYILNSTQEMAWSGSLLTFHNGITATDAIFTLLQTETSAPRRIDLVMQGTAPAGSPDATHFKTITLNNNELIYLELDRATVLGSGGSLIIENAVDGGSTAVGKTLRKTTISAVSGIPGLLSQPNSQTFYMPIACRLNGTTDIYWIPHGIRWPAGVESSLGAVVVSGIDTWPDEYVGTLPDFQTALTTLSITGGVICITDPFQVDTPVVIPDNVMVVGKSLEKSKLTFVPGGTITMGSNSEIRALQLVAFSTYAGGLAETMVTMGGTRGITRDCRFVFNNVGAFIATGLAVSGADNGVYNNEFIGVSASATKDGLKYLNAAAQFEEGNRFT